MYTQQSKYSDATINGIKINRSVMCEVEYFDLLFEFNKDKTDFTLDIDNTVLKYIIYNIYKEYRIPQEHHILKNIILKLHEFNMSIDMYLTSYLKKITTIDEFIDIFMYCENSDIFKEYCSSTLVFQNDELKKLKCEHILSILDSRRTNILKNIEYFNKEELKIALSNRYFLISEIRDYMHIYDFNIKHEESKIKVKVIKDQIHCFYKCYSLTRQHMSTRHYTIKKDQVLWDLNTMKRYTVIMVDTKNVKFDTEPPKTELYYLIQILEHN